MSANPALAQTKNFRDLHAIQSFQHQLYDLALASGQGFHNGLKVVPVERLKAAELLGMADFRGDPIQARSKLRNSCLRFFSLVLRTVSTVCADSNPASTHNGKCTQESQCDAKADPHI
jgi:hypothetical protein